ncbi:hypothetical protein FNV43_RR13317 [Rhamnella rubrinervis]|uniref:Uncharacterized protein n=1 Tax=Rhamnella rubrinervis TaxID=2594499 RepID=A0A8K0H0T9_9ROSA|nr:hypothetical protein FNV43_RR13317 [Rhamnella rubrinervis]
MNTFEGIHISSTPAASTSTLDSLTSTPSTLSPFSIPPTSLNIGDDSISGLIAKIAMTMLNIFEVLMILKKRSDTHIKVWNQKTEIGFAHILLEQMENLLNQETEEGSQPPTQLEITQQVLRTKPGYYSGLGYGPKPPPSSRTSRHFNANFHYLQRFEFFLRN